MTIAQTEYGGQFHVVHFKTMHLIKHAPESIFCSTVAAKPLDTLIFCNIF